MKKVLAVLLVALLLLPCFAACKKEEESPPSPEPSDNQTDQTPQAEPISLDLVKDGKSEFVIIYPSDESEAYMDMAVALRNAIQKKFGLYLPINDDYLREGETASSDSYEILIGNTNRQESASATNMLSGNSDYTVRAVGHKLVFAGRQTEAVNNAVYYFINMILAKLKQEQLDSQCLVFTEKENYMYNANYPLGGLTLLGESLGEYSLVVPAQAGVKEQRFATTLSAFMNSMTGADLKIISDTEADGDKEIYVGKTAKTTTSVGQYEYAVAVKGNCVECVADSLYGFEAMQTAVQSLLTGGTLKNADKVNSGEAVRKDITSTLSGGTELILQKTGNLRIMYHNVWGWNESATNPTEQRNEFLYDSYLEYHPDILCLQEVTHQMRFNKTFPLLEELCRQGYAEVEVDPVDNLYTATPILYRTDVVKVIDKGVTKFTYGGGSDKFVTWAVFETLDADGNGTGVKLGVMSIHLAYQSGTEGNDYRLAQVPIVVDLAKTIQRTYNCAVLAGGDMNCTIGSDPHNKYLELGFTDVWQAMEGSENRENGKSHYGYPTFNEITGMFERNITPSGDYVSGAVDHIFYLGAGSLSFKTFDIVTDNYVMCGSDHTPTVLDFDLLGNLAVEDWTKSEYSKNY